MSLSNLNRIKERLISFLIQATQNQSELRYVLFNYLYGVIFGYVLWNFVILEFYFGVEPFWILYIIILGFGAGSCFLIGFRCVITLVWLEFLGKTGINFLKAIVLVALISGPIENLTLNAKDVVRVFQCSSELMFNLTLSKVTLLSKPFQNAIRDMTSNLSQIQNSLDMITDVVSPITDELEMPFNSTKVEIPFNNTTKVETFSNESRIVIQNNDETQAKLFQQNYIKKTNDRCKAQLKSAANKCYKSFADAYDSCFNELPTIVNTLIYWPIKIDTMCSVVEMDDALEICDSSKVFDIDFGDTYAELKTLEYSMQKHTEKFVIDTNMSLNPSAQLKSMKEINKRINKQIDQKSKIVEGCIFVIRKILSLVFLRTLLGAYGFYQKYLTQIEFDNRYVTKYFEKINIRRKNIGQMHLLPLKPIDRNSIIISKFSKIKLNELWFMVPFLVKLLLEMVFASCFIILDHILYVSLNAVAEHGEITYHQEGEIIIETTVNGTGVVALLVKEFLKNFNINENISATYNNVECLPKAKKLSTWLIVKIYGIYLVIIFYKLNLTYVQRMRTTVMAIYFPKREKRRILYLYNECLKQRKRMHKSTQKMLSSKLKHQVHLETNFLMVLIDKFAPRLNWLRVIPWLRRKCLICNEIESKSYGPKNVLLSSDEFEGFYCIECWEEFSAVFDEIRLRRYSASESGSSQTYDTDSTD